MRGFPLERENKLSYIVLPKSLHFAAIGSSNLKTVQICSHVACHSKRFDELLKIINIEDLEQP